MSLANRNRRYMNRGKSQELRKAIDGENASVAELVFGLPVLVPVPLTAIAEAAVIDVARPIDKNAKCGSRLLGNDLDLVCTRYQDLHT